MRRTIQPTGRESPFDEDEIIVSKTDLKGRITYANSVFLRVSGFTAKDVIGKPHNIIRHPDMPRCVYKLMWETIGSGGEIFAYVINLARNGDHYWVFAHVTPSFDASGRIGSYHSSRRKPDRRQVEAASRLYATLREAEQNTANPKDGLVRSTEALHAVLRDKGVTYDQFVLSV